MKTINRHLNYTNIIKVKNHHKEEKPLKENSKMKINSKTGKNKEPKELFIFNKETKKGKDPTNV